MDWDIKSTERSLDCSFAQGGSRMLAGEHPKPSQKEIMISEIPLVTSLTGEGGRILLRVLKNSAFSSGKILFREGDAADRCFIHPYHQ